MLTPSMETVKLVPLVLRNAMMVLVVLVYLEYLETQNAVTGKELLQ